MIIEVQQRRVVIARSIRLVDMRTTILMARCDIHTIIWYLIHRPDSCQQGPCIIDLRVEIALDRVPHTPRDVIEEHQSISPHILVRILRLWCERSRRALME